MQLSRLATKDRIDKTCSLSSAKLLYLNYPWQHQHQNQNLEELFVLQQRYTS
jgi:hypothetical protein